jgi:hypothetical protein
MGSERIGRIKMGEIFPVSVASSEILGKTT